MDGEGDYPYLNYIRLRAFGGTRQAYAIVRNNGGLYRELTTPDGSADPADLFFPPAELWAHVAWTVTAGEGVFTLFRDGVTRDGWGTGGGAAVNPNRVEYKCASLGRSSACRGGSGYGYFDGALRDVRLYSRALVAGEVAALAHESVLTSG